MQGSLWIDPAPSRGSFKSSLLWRRVGVGFMLGGASGEHKVGAPVLFEPRERPARLGDIQRQGIAHASGLSAAHRRAAAADDVDPW